MPCPTELDCEPDRSIDDQSPANPDYLPYLFHAMVDREGHQSTYWPAILHLTDPQSVTDELCLSWYSINMHGIYREIGISDTSFSRQMHALTRADRPDAFVAPYRSGVPLLGAVFGFYEAMGWPQPVMETVNTGGRFHDVYSQNDIRQLQASETTRLSKIIEGAKIAIIDDFFETGGTLRQSAKILRNAGALSINALCGQWYRKIDGANDKKATFTVEYLLQKWSDTMLDIGHASAEVPPSSQQRPDLEAILNGENSGDTRESFDYMITNRFISVG